MLPIIVKQTIYDVITLASTTIFKHTTTDIKYTPRSVSFSPKSNVTGVTIDKNLQS